MPSKKSAPKKSKSTKAARRGRSGAQLVRVHGAEEAVLPLLLDWNGKGDKQPRYLNPETKEDREKRLAARKALTLKAFQMAYENHHGRKVS